MSEIPREINGPQADNPEVLEHLPKRLVMAPVHTLASMVMRAHTYFEEGARDDLHEHRNNGGSLLVLMTHFRRWEPIVIAQAARVNEPLQHLQYNTGITARRDMGRKSK